MAGLMACVAKINLIAKLVAWEGQLDIPLEALLVIKVALLLKYRGRLSSSLYHLGLR